MNNEYDAGFDAALDQIEAALNEALSDEEVDEEGSYGCPSYYQLVWLANLVESLREQ